MIKEAKYDSRKKYFDIQTHSLGEAALYDIEREGKLYGSTMEDIGDYLQSLQGGELEEYKRSKIKLVRQLNPLNLNNESHVKIYHDNEGRSNFEELLKIDKSIFILLDHNRGTIKTGTILSVVSSPWEVGTKLKFEFIDLESSLKTYYETGKVTKIEVLSVPYVFSVLETKLDALRITVYAPAPDKLKGFDEHQFSLKPDEGLYFKINQNLGKADFSFIELEGTSLINILDKLKILSLQHVILKGY